MGVNKLLKAGIEGEKALLTKASSHPKIQSNAAESNDTPTFPKEEIKSIHKKDNERKHNGGRPTNKSKGKISRKQYSLTLRPDDYQKIMDLADADGISFSKYIERAVNDYISRHN